MELEGPNVVKYLNGYDTVRDGALISFSIQHLATEPAIDLVFEVPSRKGSRVVRLELRGVQEFEYYYTKENPPEVIQFVKCLLTDVGEFYLSLDPYNEHEISTSEKDNDFFDQNSCD